MERYSHDALVALVPLPNQEANKYSRGKVTIVGGSKRYPGAVCLAGSACQRMGAGYTEIRTHPLNVALANAYRASLVAGSWKPVRKKDFFSKKPLSQAYIVGPGMVEEKGLTEILTQTILCNAQVPVLIDGGALAVLATTKAREICRQRFISDYATIITPHGGEAEHLAQLLGLENCDDKDRALRLAQVLGVTVVLKGPDTFISDGDDVYPLYTGTPALAKAGTGDVLAGIIGALLAQGVAALDACMLGVELHALAGRRGSADLTPVSLIAEDVINYLPHAISDLVG